MIFAHPDDESAGCAGTIKQLVDQGDQVFLVCATDGNAGEICGEAKKTIRNYSCLGDLRREEMANVCKHLGIAKHVFLNFDDGKITNCDVWDTLQQKITETIDIIKPDVVVTFDHSGWYYHLDHVGVSIATTIAYQQATHRPHALLFSLVKMDRRKWHYIFKDLPYTHQVEVKDKKHKLKALALHGSQNLEQPRKWVEEREPHCEFFQLALADEKGTQMFEEHPIFTKVII